MSKPHLLFVAALLLGACGESVAATPEPAPSTDRSVPDHPGMPEVEASEVKRLEGAVAEVLDAGRYTYVRLTTANGERWAVSMGELDLDLGAEAAFVIHYQQQDFHSRILDRDFDQLFFGQLIDA